MSKIFRLRKNKIKEFLQIVDNYYLTENPDKKKDHKKGTTTYWKNQVNVFFQKEKKLVNDQKRLYFLAKDFNDNEDIYIKANDIDLYPNDANQGSDYVKILNHLSKNLTDFGVYIDVIEQQNILENFETNRWYFYYYDSYVDKEGKHEGIGRAILEILDISKKEIFLHNRIQNQGHRSHANYIGKYSIYTYDYRFLEMNLKTASANSKDMRVLVDIGDSNKCDLALGLFHNFTDGHSLFSKTVIIEKIIDKLECNKFVFFKKNTPEYDSIHPSIRDYFKDKHLNKLKLPNKNVIYNIQNLTDWITKKKAIIIPLDKKEYKSIYLTSPILYFDYDRVNQEEGDMMYNTQLSFDKKIKAELEKLGYEVNYFGENRKYFYINNQMDGGFTNREIKNVADKSDIFVVIYPDFSKNGRPISILLEIGYLISKYKKTYTFYPDNIDSEIPLLLRGAELLNIEAKSIKYTTPQDIIKQISLYFG